MCLIFCPVALLMLTVWLARAFDWTTPSWVMGLIMAVGGTFGHFVFSRIAVAHLRQFYPDYVQNELRHEPVPPHQKWF
jgi:hypothetical protein